MANNVYPGYFSYLYIPLLTIFMILVCVLQAEPSDPIPTLSFRHIQNGLSQNNVRCIVEDTDGYIWVGTEGGLNQFDGINFRVFEMNESDSTAIPDNRINDLYIDSRQNLWIATYNALALYVKEYEQFTIFNKEPQEGEGPYLDALTLFEDRSHQLWVGTQHGVYVLDSTSNLLKKPLGKEMKKLESLYIYAIEEVGEDLLFGTKQGLFLLDRTNKVLQEVISSQGKKLEEIRDVTKDSFGRLWIATHNHGLFRLDQDVDGQWLFTSYFMEENSTLDDKRIFTVFEDSHNRIWVGTESKGLNLYIPQTDSFEAFGNESSDETALKTNSIWEIYEDRSGRLYFGSNNQGMFVHDPYVMNFNHVDRQSGKQLKFGTVSAFLEDGDDMWIATDGGGISIWDRKHDTYSFFNHDPAVKGSLGSNEVLVLFRDSQGIIWTGNWNGGLNKYDPATRSFQTYKNTDSDRSIGSNQVCGIVEDQHGDLWMSTWGHGLSRYNRATDDFFNIGYVPYDNNHMGHEMTYDLEIDDVNGDIWVATVLGVDRVTMLDDSTYGITHFRYEQEDKQSLSAVNVHCIFEDHQNRIWIGTSSGLNLYDRTNENFTRFYTQDGLPGNVIKDILQDNDHNFWVSTNKGLARMKETQEGYSYELYHKADGLQADEFFLNSSFKASSGELFLGGMNGFNHFDPSAFRLNSYAPHIQFTQFTLFNEEVEIGGADSPLPRHINTLDTIKLRHKQFVFSIEFQGLNMTRPEKHLYTYKLKGFDEKWSPTSTRNVATYTNLDPGDYVFQVKAANRDGVWNEHPREVHITVLPPWWLTWWAKLIFVAGPLALLISLVQIRFSLIKSQKRQLAIQVALQTAELRKQKEEIEIQADQLAKVNHQKNKLFSIISHDLRSPLHSLKGLTSILDPSILSSGDLGKIKADINSRIEHIGQVMVNLLEWSKSQLEGEVSKVENFDLAMISEEICNLYRQTADEKQVILTNAISTPLMVQADPNQIRAVFRNLIGNSLKFTHARDMIRIDSNLSSDQEALIHISDTGIGMNADQVDNLFRIECNHSTRGTAGEKGVGLGMLLVKEFIDKNGGTLSVESTPGKGTTFCFSLPVVREVEHVRLGG